MTGELAELVELPVNGGELLDQVKALIGGYVVMPSPEAADAVTLYAAATYAASHAHAAPRLIVRSPEKRSGKTRLIVDVLGSLVSQPLTAVSLSPAALVHSIDADNPPTLIMDETDTVFSKGAKDERTELLRGILNSGFNRGGSYIRHDAKTRENYTCQTFAMAILGGIDNGRMPDTIEDRAIIISLRRKMASESVHRFRTRRDQPRMEAMADRLSVWITPRAAELADAEPDLPDELNDRAQDVWEPLLAVADLAGGDWPARARRAALALSGDAEDSEQKSRLLSDLRDVFYEGEEALHTRTILERLHKIDEAPWGEWFGGQLTARELAKMLRPYGVKPVDVKLAGQVRKGYHRKSLHETWERYLGPVSGTPNATSATSATALLRLVADKNEVALPPQQVAQVADKGNPGATTLTCKVAQVAEVADTPPEPGHMAEPLHVMVPADFTESDDDERRRLEEGWLQ